MPVVNLDQLEPVDGDPFDPRKGFGTLKPDNPSWGDRLAGGFSNVMGMLGATPQGQRNAYGVAQTGVGLIPGVSNAVAGNQAYRDFGQGNYGSGVLNTLAALPIPGASILSKEADTAAKEMTTLYHVTPKANLQAIYDKGLIPSNTFNPNMEPSVNLWASPGSAKALAASRNAAGTPNVVLPVQVPTGMLSKETTADERAMNVHNVPGVPAKDITFPKSFKPDPKAETIGGKMITDAGTPGILSYHGSPYKFDAFDWSKIGKGEGTQDEGYGLYTAAHPAVGESYRNQFTHNHIVDASGKPYESWFPVHSPEDMAHFMLKVKGSYKDARQAFKDSMDLTRALTPKDSEYISRNQKSLDHLDNLEKEGVTVTQNKANKYQVAIHENPDHYLDRDAMYKDMDPHVQNALKQYGYDKMSPEMTGAEIHEDMIGKHLEDMGEEADNVDSDDISEASERATSQLRNAGIPGIKYLDSESENLEDVAKTHNYVSFNARNMKILKRYVVPALGAAGAMHILTTHPDIEKYQLEEQD